MTEIEKMDKAAQDFEIEKEKMIKALKGLEIEVNKTIRGYKFDLVICSAVAGIIGYIIGRFV